MFRPLLTANLKMMVRDRQALFWAIVFPLIFVVVFGLFRMDQANPVTIAVIDKAQDPVSSVLVENLKTVELLKLDLNMTEAQARQSLKEGKTNFVLVIPEGLAAGISAGQAPAQLTVIYDEARVSTNQIMLGVMQQFIDQANMSLQQARPLIELKPEGIQARRIGYFDFLLPGFVGMAVMTSGIFGMATTIAVYRQRKIFKRLLTTPLSVRTFFAAQVASSLILSVVQSSIIIAAGVFLFNGHIYGNLLWLYVLVFLANTIFLNIGFVIGSIARTEQAANGLANVISMPMMFFSGVFFPTESLPGIMAKVVQYLPLTPLLDAMRGVALEAKPFWAYPWELALLGLWIVLTSAVAVRVFKFG